MQRLFRAIREFGVYGILHACTAASGIVYNLLQMIVLAHSLSRTDYARVVAVTVISLYLQVLNQSVGRASFIMVREKSKGEAGPTSAPEVTAILYGNSLLMFATCFIIPLVVHVHSVLDWISLSFWLAFCIFCNLFSYDLQSALWASGITKAFDVHSLPRRLANFACLYYLWATGNFLMFGILNVLCSIVSVITLIWYASTITPLFLPSELLKLQPRNLVREFKVMGSSILSAMSELIIFNGPYSVLGWIFGVGPIIICYDTVMKCVRIALVGSRIFAEIVLPSQRKAQEDGNQNRSRNLLAGATIASFAVNVVLAGALMFGGPYVFHLLLGHNNVLPPQLGAVAGALVILSVLYQPAALMVSYNGLGAVIRRVTLTAVIGMIVFASFLYVERPSLLMAMWSYVGYFAAVTLVIGIYASSSFGFRRNRAAEASS